VWGVWAPGRVRQGWALLLLCGWEQVRARLWDRVSRCWPSLDVMVLGVLMAEVMREVEVEVATADYLQPSRFSSTRFTLFLQPQVKSEFSVTTM
jgi:hypothetical protein